MQAHGILDEARAVFDAVRVVRTALRGVDSVVLEWARNTLISPQNKLQTGVFRAILGANREVAFIHMCDHRRLVGSLHIKYSLRSSDSTLRYSVSMWMAVGQRA